MERNAPDSSPSTSPNGLKRVFSRSNRSRTTLSDREGSTASSHRSTKTSVASQHDGRKQSASNDAISESGRSGIAKLIRKKHRKKQHDGNKPADQQQSEVRSPIFAGDELPEAPDSRESHLTASTLDGAHVRSRSDPGNNLLTDDSTSEEGFGLDLISSNSVFYPSQSPVVRISTSIPDLPMKQASTLPLSTSDEDLGSIDQSRLPRRAATSPSGEHDSDSSRGAGVDTSLAGSASKILKDTFSITSGSKSPSSSLDRASSKQSVSGGKSGQSFLSRVRKPSISKGSSKDSSSSIAESVVRRPSPSTDSQVSRKELPPLDTKAPRTPPSTDTGLPVMTTTPPTPTDHGAKARTGPVAAIMESLDNDLPPPAPPSSTVIAPSDSVASHRRIHSASAASTHPPSKLSSSITAPLTPPGEENGKTNGAKSLQGSQAAGGFFSSMFSAAQNAATSLTSSLNNQSRSRTSTQTTVAEKKKDKAGEEAITQTSDNTTTTEEKKEATVDTLGTGDLNFGHLGIDASSAGAVITTKDGVVYTPADLAAQFRKSSPAHRDELAARIEDLRAARAVSMAYKKPADAAATATPPTIDEAATGETRPSASELAAARDSAGDNTPPGGSLYEGETSSSVKRSGSVRSRLQTRRHRGSSGATGSTIGAIGAAAAIGLGLPVANSSAQRLTGFAVASKKRNRDFHQLFRSVPEDDYLIEDYSCALQREIILAGRLYISEGHICFSSNILGWVTTLVISFDEVMAIEKETTAMVFPNAIAIQTLHARHTFRSLLSRESTYDLMVNIWKINHPTLKSSVNGTKIDQGTGDRTENADDGSDTAGSASHSEEDEVYDEDEEGQGDEISINGVDVTESSTPASSTLHQAEPINRVSRRTLTVPAPVTSQPRSGAVSPNNIDMRNGEKPTKPTHSSSEAGPPFPGPVTHTPTEFIDPSGYYEKVLKVDVIPAPLGRVYSLVFGAESGAFMTKFLLEDQRVTDLQLEDDQKGITTENKTRTYQYIKPLNSPIGPKQTKCICTETLDIFDLDKAVLATIITQTPDVPNGNLFCVKTKYLFTWAPGNATRFYMTCTIEWTGKSWIKGPIEKGAHDGQAGFGTTLVKSLKTAVTSRSRSTTVSKGIGKGRDKRKRAATEAIEAAASASAALGARKRQTTSWGLLEPLRGTLTPLIDSLRPLLGTNVAVGIVCVLIFMTWFRTPPQPALRPGSILSMPERLVAYEELWQKEESELWEWFEQRVGLDGLVAPVLPHYSDSASFGQRKTPEHRELERRLREKMTEREMEDAIRITQERLEVLKRIVQERKRTRKADE